MEQPSHSSTLDGKRSDLERHTISPHICCRFGRARLYDISPVLGTGPIAQLGPDPLGTWPLGPFVEKLATQKRCVKAVLLDQKFVAGIGNWICDDVLYMAKIHPARQCETLSVAEAKAIHGAVQTVVSTAVAVNAETAKLPKPWLIQVRWDRTTTTLDGKSVSYSTIAGRTTAVVSSVQRKGGSGRTKKKEIKGKRRKDKIKGKGKGKTMASAKVPKSSQRSKICEDAIAAPDVSPHFPLRRSPRHANEDVVMARKRRRLAFEDAL